MSAGLPGPGNAAEKSEGQLYGFEQALHEAAYVYAAITALQNVNSAAQQEDSVVSDGSVSSNVDLGGLPIFEVDSYEAMRHDLALIELNQGDRVTRLSHQASILERYIERRTDQASTDWQTGENRGRGSVVLREDARYLLPMPGEASVQTLAVDYLGMPDPRQGVEPILPLVI